mmetsp:Transcript_26860/g.79393  ORF Transcript_26860/g.79393 Transcript_26860/m.79393 type:complete len:207 (-) Transcript_26860:17-637(-)
MRTRRLVVLDEQSAPALAAAAPRAGRSLRLVRRPRKCDRRRRSAENSDEGHGLGCDDASLGPAALPRGAVVPSGGGRCGPFPSAAPRSDGRLPESPPRAAGRSGRPGDQRSQGSAGLAIGHVRRQGSVLGAVLHVRAGRRAGDQSAERGGSRRESYGLSACLAHGGSESDARDVRRRKGETSDVVTTTPSNLPCIKCNKSVFGYKH